MGGDKIRILIWIYQFSKLKILVFKQAITEIRRSIKNNKNKILLEQPEKIIKFNLFIWNYLIFKEKKLILQRVMIVKVKRGRKLFRKKYKQSKILLKMCKKQIHKILKIINLKI